MSFQSPHLLWLLVPLVLLFSWELMRHSARTVANWPKIARAWAGAFDVSLGAKHTTAENRPRIWLWFGLALCLIALARPQWGVIEEQVFDQSREVIIAMDLSRSMLAQDVKPSRLDRSKLLITSLLDGLKGERVGLVLFSGTAFLQSPLSSDYEVLREFLPVLNTDYLPEGGTNYKALLETSMQAFGTSTADRYLIILSDGESTEDEWQGLTGSLKTKGIRVIGLGVGTAQGSFIPEPGGGLVKDERGAVVMSRLNSSTLQELAQVTGGAYADASSWVDLPALLRKTVEAGRKGEFAEKNTARRIERFQWFLAPGLLLLLISFWAEFPVRPRERALPLGKARGPKTEDGGRKAVAVVAALVLFSVLCHPSSACGAESEAPSDPLAKPLSTTVARLAAKDTVTAKEYSELAQTTVTYGQRVKSSQQQPPEPVIRDALAAVDTGEKLDAKAADWPRVRSELEELLKKEEPPKQDKKDQDKKDQQQQDKQQQKDQQKQDQNKDQQDQKKQDQQSQDQKDQQPQQQNKDAFGDMKDKPDQKKAEPKPSTPPAGTQKVGGQQEKQPAEPIDAELAMPLQKLEQVRNQDSPAKLQQIMQGPQQKPKTTGKNW
ncbi:VWA domain-containing protein [Opitutus sp. GAS368]|uniref:VWA domain-containing protein n=1 Tax=Opitutus sp. GAS368 TaxID=1882749 RepID=UPI00087DEF1E|nr:VWA domain-containing protein [Opitutus sp. GAS368]SDS21585.1 Ca-activated chloride channel family protein [Opitutus sp. GAS368]